MVATLTRNIPQATSQPTTVQAIGYVRRSTNRQEESLEQQREKLQAFAAARGWELVEVYADDAISGSQMHRAGLDSLMEHAEKSPEVGVVLAWERNRLARPKDPVDGLLLERRLIQAGKRVFYVATGQEADRSFTSGLVGFVEHYQNGDYLRKLSRDAMRGIVARAKRGLWPSGMVPFGYDRLCLDTNGQGTRIIRNMPDKSQLVLHPDTRAVIEHVKSGHRYQKPEHETVTLIPSEPARVEAVRKLFADYLAGVPFRVLRDNINASGMRTVFGGIFTIGTLHGILRNPAYKGVLMFNRCTVSKWHRYTHGKSVERHDEGEEQRDKTDWIVVDNAWPALVEATLFDQVQEKLAQVQQENRHVTGQSVRQGYLLTGGTLKCGICGGNLIGQTDKIKRANGTVYRRRTYICGVHHKGQVDLCPTRYYVPVETVESRIWQFIQDDLRQLQSDDTLHAYFREELAKLCGGKADTHKSLQARLADVESQIGKLTAHLSVMDVQTATTLGLYAKAKALAEERQQVQDQLAALAHDVPEIPSMQDIARNAQEELAKLDHLRAHGSLEEKRELVRMYVKGIKVDPKAQVMELSVVPALFSWITTGV
jgi:site-specific DNA recombinase